jgi:hypothetical protein
MQRHRRMGAAHRGNKHRVRRGHDEFHIEPRYLQEEVSYREGERAYLFDATWGKLWRLYVPSRRIWYDVMPEWLRGRREIVIERLTAPGRLSRRPRYAVVETERGYVAGTRELRPVTSAREARAIAIQFFDRNNGLLGPRTPESVVETERGWLIHYRYLEPARAPALPDGRTTLLVRRETGEIET